MQSTTPSATTARMPSRRRLRKWRNIGRNFNNMKTLSRLALIILLLLLPGGAQEKTVRGGIRVKVGSLQPLRLQITLQCGANKRVVIDKGKLPWATRYNMVLVAATSDSEALEKVLPVEDPAWGDISVEPGQILTGTLHLEGIFKGFDEARKKGDIHLFWAYQATDGLGIPRWSGGWILLPQSKAK